MKTEMNIRQMAEQQIELELSEFFKARKLNSHDVRLLLDGLFMVDPNAKVWQSGGQLFISDFPFSFATYKGTAIEMIEYLIDNGKLADHDLQHNHALAYLWAAQHQTSTEMLSIVAGYFTHKKVA